MARKDLREKILNTASQLFYRDGIHATGVDTIVAEAGVNKMTMYRYFPSKHDLVMEVLKKRDEDWRLWFFGMIDNLPGTAAEKLTGVFDVLQQWFCQPDFHGCAFVNAAAQFTNADHPAHQVASGHLRLICERVQQLCRQAGAEDPEKLGRQICLLITGCITSACVTSQSDAALFAREAAARLLEGQIPPQ